MYNIPVHTNFFLFAVRKKARPVLYTNMTPTKPNLALKALN